MSNIKVLENGDILVKNVILSYPHLFTPYGKGTDTKKYSAKFLMPKSTHKPDIVQLNQLIAGIAMARWKQKLPMANLFLKDGTLVAKNDGDENYFILAASELTRPAVINGDKSPIAASEADDKMYPGAIVNVLIRPWEQDNEWGKKVNANLLAVQYVRKGERLAAARTVDTDAVFDEISGFDDEDDTGLDDGFGGGDDGFGG